MTTFEIIILAAIYIFAMLVETGFQVEDSVTEKNMSNEDKWYATLAVMLAPFALAFQLGQLLQQKFINWKEELKKEE